MKHAGAGWRDLALAAILMGAGSAIASGESLTRPGNGLTEMHLVGDGTPGMMVIGRRENFNAHSFDVVSLFIRLDDQWQLVPVYDADRERDSFTSSGGADCLLHDFRFVRHHVKAPLELVIADRDYRDSFLAVRPVVFRLYELTRNATSEPGAPMWSFRLRSTRTSAKSYCDVGDAFAHESTWRE